MGNIKIGIYGGTFDPVHLGHIRSAYAFLTACQLDRLFIMPNYIPPHKTPLTGNNPSLRLQMLNIAFAPLPFYNDKIIVSDYEIRQKDISYTYKTLEHFKFISDDLTFLCGTDSFLDLENWKEFEKIFNLAKIAHIVRPNTCDVSQITLETKEKYRQKYNAKIVDVPMAPIDISSTEIRNRIKNKQDTSTLIPQDVRNFIDNYNIYGEDNV